MLAGRVGHELEHGPVTLAVRRCDADEAQPRERVEQAALGRLDAVPAVDVLRHRQVGQDARLAARHAERIGIARRHREVAGLVGRGVLAQPVLRRAFAAAARRVAPPEPPRRQPVPPRRVPGGRAGTRGAAALQALHVLEEQRMAAMVAAEGLHRTRKWKRPGGARVRVAGPALPGWCRLRTHAQVVLHRAHALGVARQVFGLGFARRSTWRSPRAAPCR